MAEREMSPLRLGKAATARAADPLLPVRVRSPYWVGEADVMRERAWFLWDADRIDADLDEHAARERDRYEQDSDRFGDLS